MSAPGSVDTELGWLAARPDAEPVPSRDAVRRALGLEPGVLAVAPLADDARSINARRAVFLAGVIEMLGQPVALILPETATGLGIARAFAAEAGLTVRIITVPPPLVASWPALDVAFEIDQTMAHLDATPAQASLDAWAARCGVAIRRSLRKPILADAPSPPVPPTLWWASELPASLRENP